MKTAKTSESDPLRIIPVTVPGASGIIGLTFCPGKTDAFASAGPWDRDLDTDLDAIKAFGATALVTLMEPDELTNVRVPESALGSKASAHRIEWHLLPIRDVSVPDEQFEDQWTYSGAKLRDHLRHENNVVIHCRGGLGRTGTIAARLLVEFGESAESAIARVRHARPGSIETPRQEEYVRSCERLAMMSSATGEAFLRVRHRLRLLLGRDYTHLWSSRRVLRISQRSEPEIPR